MRTKVLAIVLLLGLCGYIMAAYDDLLPEAPLFSIGKLLRYLRGSQVGEAVPGLRRLRKIHVACRQYSRCPYLARAKYPVRALPYACALSLSDSSVAAHPFSTSFTRAENEDLKGHYSRRLLGKSVTIALFQPSGFHSGIGNSRPVITCNLFRVNALVMCEGVE